MLLFFPPSRGQVGCRDTGWTLLLLNPNFTTEGKFISLCFLIWYRSLRICLQVSFVSIKWLFSLPNNISRLYPWVSWVTNQLGNEYSDVLLISTLNSALLLQIRALFFNFLFQGWQKKTGVVLLTADELANIEGVFKRCLLRQWWPAMEMEKAVSQRREQTAAVVIGRELMGLW